MVVLLAEKLGITIKFPFKMDNHPHNSKALSASLHDFQSKTSNFLTSILLKPANESEFKSLAWFHNCFELMHATHRAFADLVVEIDYPMSKWGGKATGEYLNYTLVLLNMLNSVSSSVSHINQAKISIFHGLCVGQNSPSSAGKYLKKIAKSNLGKDLRLEGSRGIEIRPSSNQKECVILQALIILKKIGFFAIGLVLSGLSCGAKLDLEIGKFPRGCNDPFEGPMEVEEVNHAVLGLSAAISNGRFDEAVGELKRRLNVMDNSIQSIEKEVNNLFSEVIATRNKLLDNICLVG